MPRLKPKSITIESLYGRACNQCSFPGCEVACFPEKDITKIAQICHIEAAEKGGQRYNAESTDEYRRNYDNLIVLCPNHHKETDNVKKYPVEALKAMRAEHEEMMEQKVISKKPGLILTAINALANIDWDMSHQYEDTQFFSIEDKISHNKINRWLPRITAYKKYQGKVESIYNRLEQDGEIFKKHKLLQLIRNVYLTTKGNCGKHSSDDILDQVEAILLTKVQIYDDDKIIAIPIIMVDAFMRCKILEKPPNQ